MVPAPLAIIACPLATGWLWDRIMDALAAGHGAAVQMIDTSVVRVHQHGWTRLAAAIGLNATRS